MLRALPPTLLLQLSVLVLGLLLSISSITSHDAESTYRVSGEIILFVFDRDACLSGNIPDALAGPAGVEDEDEGPLLGSLAVQGLFCRPTGNGITNNATGPRFIERVSSTETAERWGGLFSSTRTLTVETWLRYDALTANDTSTYVIFSIDFPSTSTVAPDLGLIMQSGTLRVVTGSTASTSVAGPSVKGIPAGNLHVVYTCEPDPFSEMGSHYCMLYVNGQPVNDGAIDVRITINAQSRLFFFSEPEGMALRTSHPFRGNIYLWALYSRVLSPAEVTQNYNARVPNSRPIALAATHIVQENGEVGTHYDTPEYYLAPVPVSELVILTLEVLDGDHDTSSPNYNSSIQVMTMPLFYLATLPTRGTLYYLNGTAITAGSLPIALDLALANGSTSSAFVTHIRYRPGWKEISWPAVYTTFSFYALDGITGLASDTATVFIQVKAVHEIPRAGILDDKGNVTFLSVKTMAGRLTAVTLMGTASEGFRIMTAQIASLPTHGHLYRLDDTNATTPLLVGDELAITPLAPAQLAYLYTGPQVQLLQGQDNDYKKAHAARINDNLATDAFTYIVIDSFNASSVPGTLHLVVVPSLVALPTINTPIVPENTLTPVYLYGMDHQSLEHRELCFEITGLPHHGTLHILRANGTSDAVTSVPFRLPDQVSSFPYETGVTVHYVSDAGFFTQPNRTWNGTALFPEGEVEEGFYFRVVACESGMINASNILPSTRSMWQQLAVQNENAATTIDLGTSNYSVYATTNLDNVTPLGTNPTQVVLEAVSISDPDLGIDPVLVNIACTYGSIRLNENNIALADFTSSRYCPTNCLKKTSKLLRFVTTPQDLDFLLNGLAYSTTVPNIVDQIEISVYDGVGPPCLAADVLPAGSGRTRGCMTEEVRVSVTVQDFMIVSTFDEKRKRANENDQSYLSYMIAALLLIILTTISMCACCCCCPKFLLRYSRCCLVAPRPHNSAEA